jgi:hypothetical protein
MSDKVRRMAHARSPRAVLEDLAEIERLVRAIRARYTHAHDLAYSQGTGAPIGAGGSRGDIRYSRPTEAAALSEGKDRARAEVARAGREVRMVAKHIGYAHSAVVNAMPGSDPYEPTWKPSATDGIATRAERIETQRKQRERSKAGEM